MSRRRSRECSFRGRWSRHVLAMFSLGFVLVALLAMGAPGDLEAVAEARQGSSADEPSGEDGDVRCPDCDDKGRMSCARCDGKGLLPRKCPRCDATGRRPCKACTEGESADSPGRLVCPACAGDGTVGDGRNCSRCSGGQTVACGACLGKGSHSCRKHIFDTVCPDCKFSGKIACTTCGGELWMAPAVLASRKAGGSSTKPGVKDDPDAPTATRPVASTKRRRSSRDDIEEEEEPAEIDTDELRTRFARVTPTYESHYDLFVDDLRFEISALADKVKDLEGALRNARTARPLRTELDAWQKRAREFQKRWGELRSLFNKEHQAHLNARRVWEARDEGLKGLKGYRRELFDKQNNSRVRITTEIAETASARLAHFQPGTLADESRQLTILWKEYEKRGEAELAEAARKAAEEAELAAEKKKAYEAKKEEEKRNAERAAERKRRAQQIAERARRDARSSRSDLSSRAKSKDRAKPEEKRVFRRASEKDPEPQPEGGGPLRTVFAVIIGFAIASCAFCVRGFWHRRNGQG